MVEADDFRFLVTEDAISRLENIVKTWGLPYPVYKNEALETLRKLRSSFLKVKYSFLPAKMLVFTEDYRRMEKEAGRLKEMLLPRTPQKLQPRQAYRLAEIRYALWILLGLRNRLLLGDENVAEFAVDVVGVEVTSVARHPELEKLYVTRATTGTAVFTIVTNIKDIRVGETRAAALLPPAMFGDVVSEAMYASDPLPEKYRGRRIPLDLLSGEVRAWVMRIAGKRR